MKHFMLFSLLALCLLSCKHEVEYVEIEKQVVIYTEKETEKNEKENTMIKAININDIIVMTENGKYLTFAKDEQDIASNMKEINFFDTEGNQLSQSEFTLYYDGDTLRIKRVYKVDDEEKTQYFVQKNFVVTSSDYEEIPQITQTEVKTQNFKILKDSNFDIFNNKKEFTGWTKTGNGYFVGSRASCFGGIQTNRGLLFVSERGLELAYNYALTTSVVLDNVKAIYY